MTDQLAGANGAVFLVSAARTPIGRFGGGGSVAMAFERVA